MIDNFGTIKGHLVNLESRCAKYAQRLVGLSYYPLRLALLCSLLVFLTGGDALMSILAGYDKVAESVTWQFLEKQIVSPLTTFSDREAYHHISKMTYRLFPAYLGKLCWGCSLRELMLFLVGLEYLAGFLFFYFSYQLFRRYCPDAVALTWLLLGFCFIFLGKVFFWDIYAYFDAYALLFLLLAIKSRNPALVFFFLFLAFWTDERSIVASALVWLWHALRPDYSDQKPAFFQKAVLRPNKPQGAILLAVLSTLVLRWLLAHRYGLPSVAGFSQILTEVKFVLIKQRLIELIPFVTISSFESYWLYILGALLALWLHRERWELALFLLALGASLGVSFLVYDMTRSLMYAFPAIFIAVRILLHELPPAIFRRLAFWVSVAALLFPTYYLSHYMWPFFIRLLRFH